MKLATWVFCMFVALSASAQSSKGTLTGQVRDTSGALIPNADLTIMNSDTRVSIHVRTTSEGLYRVPDLEPGTYSVLVVKKGFGAETITGLVVETARSTSADAALSIGYVETMVTVTANEQLLSPDSATLTSTIDSKLAGDVPLPETSALSLALLTAGATGDPQYSGGVQSENPNAFTQPSTPGASISLSGGRPGSTAQLIDGLDVTLSSYPRAGITFSARSIQQITLQQNGIAAQYGRTGGGVINQSTASGTAKYHGYFEYRHLDPFLEAYTYGSLTAPARHQNRFTVTIGGPVPLPSSWGKTFFFGSFEPLRASDNTTVRLRLVTPDEAAGRLNNSLDLLNQTILGQQGYAAAIAAPRAGNIYYQFALNAQGFPTGLQKPKAQYVPVPNNDLSAQVAQNPFAKAVFARMPLDLTQNSPYARFLHPDASYDSDGNNGIGSRGVQNHDNRYNFRIDHSFNDRNQIYGRYTSVPVSGVRFNYFGPDNPLGNIPTDTQLSKNIVLGYTHVFNGSEVNQLRASYIRSNRLRAPTPVSLTQDYSAALGLLPAAAGAGFPGLSFSAGSGAVSLQGFGSGGSIADGGTTIDSSLSIGDDFTVVAGLHSIQFGGEFRALQNNREDLSYLYGGQYSFNTGLTNNGSVGGSSLASFDLGILNTFTTASPQPYYYRDKYFAAYIQDDWRVSRNLTLNLGLRYNLEPPRTEKYNLQGTFLPGVAGTAPNSLAATGAFAFSGQNGLPTTLWPTFYKGFEPRLGAALLLRPWLTLRSSYALVHLPLTGLGNAPTPNLSTASQAIGPINGGVNPLANVNLITNPIASIAASAAPRTGPLFSYSSTAPLPSINQSTAVPYSQLWSLSLQFAIGSSTLIETSYAGQKGTHLFSLPVATNVDSLAQSVADARSGLNFTSQSVTNPYGLGTETLLQSRLPFQQFVKNPINTAFDREGSSNYNALYATVRHRYSKGLNVFGSFTWSKSMDTSSSGSLTTITTDIYGYVGPQLPYSSDGEYSLSEYDTPVRVTGGYSYDLPFGKGRKLRSESGFINALIGGFKTSGVLTAQSGTHSGLNSATAAGSRRPSQAATTAVADAQLQVRHFDRT